MKNVLVTGGAGYIGSHTCKALAQAGYAPISVDNLSNGHRRAVKWGPFEHTDLADRYAIENIIREYEIAAVLHFAAYAYVGESIDDPKKYFRNNVANTLNLLEAMLAENVGTIVFSSTCATYGIPAAVPITEDCPQQPINPYGEAKLFVERMLRWFGEAYRLNWCSLRYFNAAGADPDLEIGEDHDPETHLIPLAIQAAHDPASPLKIFGTDYPTPDGTAIRDYIHVTDIADAHVCALEYLLADGESTALNLGTGSGHSVRQVVEAVGALNGDPISTLESPRRPGDPPKLIADPSKAVRLLGWKPRHSSLSEIVETAWRWHEHG